MRRTIAFAIASLLIAGPVMAQSPCDGAAMDAAQMVMWRNMGQELPKKVMQKNCIDKDPMPMWPGFVCDTVTFSANLVYNHPEIQEREARMLAYDNCQAYIRKMMRAAEALPAPKHP